MRSVLIKACVLLAVTTHVNSQYSDFFSSLNAFLQPFATTKRHDVTKHPDVRHKHTNKHKNDDTIHFQTDEVKDLNLHPKRKSSHTTVSPRPKSVNSNKISRNGGVIRSISESRDPYNDVDYKQTNDDHGNWNYGTTNRHDINNHGTNQLNRRTTINPLLNRPGVKPAVVDDSRPPITNKPVTVRPVYDIPFDSGTYRPVNTRPYEDDRQNFNSRPANTRPPFEVERPRPGTTNRPITVRPSTVKPSTVRPSTEEPDIEIGPDEDDMSETEKRRYYSICEQKCSEYKSSNTRKVVALPLAVDQRAEFNVTSCSRTKVPLIIGGQAVEINQFPHMALVGWRKLQGGGYSWKCGGSLVSERHILTAGHCTYFDKDDQIVSGAPHAVQLGSSHMDGRDGTVVTISTIIRHPKYKLRRSYYDVAVIKLMASVRFSERISPACLGVVPHVGEPIIATGWGKTEFGGDHSVELRSVSLPIWDINECREIWGTSRKLPQGPMADNQVCAGERKGAKDTCQGDSGGPAQIQDGCAWRIVAITSVGRSCGAPDTPALYARIPRAFVGSVVYGTGGNGGGTGNNGGGTGNNDGGIGNNGGGIGNNGGGNSGNSWGTGGNNSGPNRGTDSNVWSSNNGGINTNGNSGNSWATNNRGTESNAWGTGNNRGTDSNVWGISNSGSSNRETSNNNRGTEGSSNNNSGSSNNWGTSSSHYGIGSNIRDTSYNNGGTVNRGVDNVWASTPSNNRNNNRQDSWVSASNNRETETNSRGNDNNSGGKVNNSGGKVNSSGGNVHNDGGNNNNDGGNANNWNNRRVANVRPDLNKETPKTTTIGYEQNHNFGQRDYENSGTTENPNYSQNYYSGYNSFPGGVPWWT